MTERPAAFLDIFASYPLEPGWARDIVFGPDGDLYVSTLYLGVFRFDGNSGEPLGSFAFGEDLGPIVWDYIWAGWRTVCGRVGT